MENEKSYSKHEKKIIRLMTNSISRTNRALHKAKNLYYENIPALEIELLNKKQRLHDYKQKIK